MKYLIGAIGMLAVIAGCSTAGSGGAITRDGGLEATCAGGCAEYKADGTGCARFHESTSTSCATYFEKLCAAAPGQCVK